MVLFFQRQTFAAFCAFLFPLCVNLLLLSFIHTRFSWAKKEHYTGFEIAGIRPESATSSRLSVPAG
jgi:hypothetical protein